MSATPNTTRYRVDVDDPRIIIEVECSESGYPHKDADGHTQYDNTHFDSIDEAKTKAIVEAQAWVSLAGRDVINARLGLRRAEEKAANAAAVFTAVQDMAHRIERQAASRGV